MAERDRPFVFVIMPFGAEWRDVYRAGIKVACERVGVDCSRVDEQEFTRSILDRIYSEIAKADVVVAELTSQNTNVYYETGFAHGLAKPVILLTADEAAIPFDFKQYPHVIYGGSIADLTERLVNRLRWCLDNPDQAKPAVPEHGEDTGTDLETMAQHIEKYLRQKPLEAVTFNGVRRYINRSYRDEDLLRLIHLSPGRFRQVDTRAGTGIGLAPRK